MCRQCTGNGVFYCRAPNTPVMFRKLGALPQFLQQPFELPKKKWLANVEPLVAWCALHLKSTTRLVEVPGHSHYASARTQLDCRRCLGTLLRAQYCKVNVVSLSRSPRPPPLLSYLLGAYQCPAVAMPRLPLLWVHVSQSQDRPRGGRGAFGRWY